MDFAHEHYVRLYTRDTPTWSRLGWDGQCVLMQLLRKTDHHGAIDIGPGVEPWELVVMLCGAPEDAARRGTARCIDLGCAVVDGARLVFPRFSEAQLTAKSGAQRVREHRQRRAEVKRNVTPLGNATLQDVTTVTPCNTAPLQPLHANGSNGHGAGSPQSLRAIGHMWFAEAMGRDDYPSGGKWDLAYEQIGLKPASEKADVARAIQRQLGKPGARRIMTPRHISDYWAGFAEGNPPGDFVKGASGPLPGAAEVAAAKQAFDTARARYREATDDKTKTQLMAAWTEADAVLKATKARFQWTG